MEKDPLAEKENRLSNLKQEISKLHTSCKQLSLTAVLVRSSERKMFSGYRAERAVAEKKLVIFLRENPYCP